MLKALCNKESLRASFFYSSLSNSDISNVGVRIFQWFYRKDRASLSKHHVGGIGDLIPRSSLLGTSTLASDHLCVLWVRIHCLATVSVESIGVYNVKDA